MSATEPNPRTPRSEPPSASEGQAQAPFHEHRWAMTAHLDFCHYYTTTYACTRCRATASRTIERDPSDMMSMAAVWMEPQYREVRRDERGRFITPRQEPIVCDRCTELKAGAPIRADFVIVDKDGQVEREEHVEQEQA